jgi:sugar phosphate isomerase/epimerase
MDHPDERFRTSWTRREWLKALGGSVLAQPLLAAEKVDLKNEARRNLKLAVFSSVYGELPLESAAQRIKQDGFAGVVTDFTFVDVRFNGLSPDWEAARKITSSLERHSLKIVGIAAYYNVVDPNAERRKKGEDRIRCYIENWKRLGSPIICTETGTLNVISEWLESPDNDTEAAYLDCRSKIHGLVNAAQKTEAVVAIEAYWRNVISTTEKTQRLFHDIKSPALGLVMDPCNYFRNQDLDKMQPMLEEIFRLVGEKTVLAHAKDIKSAPQGPDLPAAGMGVLNYPLYLKLLAGLNRPLYLTLEHLGMEDVPRARDYVLKQFDRI